MNIIDIVANLMTAVIIANVAIVVVGLIVLALAAVLIRQTVTRFQKQRDIR